MNCKLCNAPDGKVLFSIAEGKDIVECSSCRLQFLYPVLTEKELEKLYDKSYYKSWGLDNEKHYIGLEHVKKSTFRLRLRQIKRYVAAGNVLDVGCANGFFLEVAHEAGFRPYGVEISSYAAKLAAEKFGQTNIFNGILENAPFGKGSMEVITMFDLIEHVYDPVVLLQKASDLLSPEGIIVITTPDAASLSRKLMGTKWTHYKLEHFFYFNLKNIELAAEKAGLQVVYRERSKKMLSIEYIHNQLSIYRHFLLSPLASVIYHLLPMSANRKPVGMRLGEFTVILKKK